MTRTHHIRREALLRRAHYAAIWLALLIAGSICIGGLAIGIATKPAQGAPTAVYGHIPNAWLLARENSYKGQ